MIAFSSPFSLPQGQARRTMKKILSGKNQGTSEQAHQSHPPQGILLETEMGTGTEPIIWMISNATTLACENEAFLSAELTGLPPVSQHKEHHPLQLSRQFKPNVDAALSNFVPENLELYAEQIARSLPSPGKDENNHWHSRLISPAPCPSSSSFPFPTSPDLFPTSHSLPGFVFGGLFCFRAFEKKHKTCYFFTLKTNKQATERR